MENRHGLLVDISVSEANGTAEREEALRLLGRSRERHELRPQSLGADKGYDAGAFLHRLEHDEGVVPLVPVRRGTIRSRDAHGQARRRARRRQRSERYRIAQRVRKRTEEIFGWAKTIGGLRRSRHVGRWKIEQQALVVGAAYNLLRLSRLRSQCSA
jgi:hypothetical protein